MRKVALFLIVCSTLTCAPNEEEMSQISETMGHMIGKNLQTLGISLDIDALVRGMHEAEEGKEAPLSDEECVQKLTALQEESLAKMSIKNLEEADQFLVQNRKKKNIISLEEGKLQYEVIQKGTGEEIQVYNMPLIRYAVRFLNGPSVPTVEELVDLSETIPGLKKALLGMKEGEKRTLYIHPDLGYEKGSQNLNANSLLIFDVEILKADASSEAHEASAHDTELPLHPTEP